MDQFNFPSKLTFMHQKSQSFILLCTTFWRPPQGLQLGPAFAKASTGPYMSSQRGQETFHLLLTVDLVKCLKTWQ
jgi:hypothetical protein